ncbi:thioredoxin-like domain-containing protein [Oerskovia sp. M15]
MVDFWAYSCINCQRAIPHVNAWYEQYRDVGQGFEVIGVHTPEFAFERETRNVVAGLRTWVCPTRSRRTTRTRRGPPTGTATGPRST